MSTLRLPEDLPCEGTAEDRHPNPTERALTVAGGAALLAAMTTDFLAVLGRHFHRPLLGSIEIVQASVLAASSIAIILATMRRRHAVVHLVTDRLSPRPREIARRLGCLIAASLWFGLTAGDVLLAIAMWPGYEESELLRIPYAPLRLLSVLASLSVALLFVREAVRREGA